MIDMVKERLKQSRAYPVLRAVAAIHKYRFVRIWFLGLRRYGLGYRRTIGFTPDMVNDFSMMKRISILNRYKLVNDEQPDIAVYWALGEGNTPPDKDWVLHVNSRCRDISKSNVDRLHQMVFGYGVSVDPFSHCGPAFVKSEENGVHDGQIQHLPVESTLPGKVYQRLVNNVMPDGSRRDIRIPICGPTIPFVYLIHRPQLDDTIGDRIQGKTTLSAPSQFLSDSEQQKVLELCSEIGLDFGEVDALRDQQDGRLYVVDVNRAVGGLRQPSEMTSESEYWGFLITLADSFEETFVSPQVKKDVV